VEDAVAPGAGSAARSSAVSTLIRQRANEPLELGSIMMPIVVLQNRAIRRKITALEDIILIVILGRFNWN